jgi:hypothetical protein
MAGYVCRDTLDLTESGDKTYQFFHNKRGGEYKTFKTRSLAIAYFLHTEHLTEDDLRFMYWYDISEEELYYLFTGEYVEGFKIIDGKIYAYNFWQCDDCGTVYRVSAYPTCPTCGTEDRFNVTVDDVPEKLFKHREKEEIKKIKSKLQV